eukprot:scaffold322_cov363-Pavlova_lutheri.AAC.4
MVDRSRLMPLTWWCDESRCSWYGVIVVEIHCEGVALVVIVGLSVATAWEPFVKLFAGLSSTMDANPLVLTGASRQSLLPPSGTHLLSMAIPGLKAWGLGVGGAEPAIAPGPRSLGSLRSGSGVGASAGSLHRHRACVCGGGDFKMVPQGVECRSPPPTDAPHSIDLTQCSQREDGDNRKERNGYKQEGRFETSKIVSRFLLWVMDHVTKLEANCTSRAPNKGCCMDERQC